MKGQRSCFYFNKITLSNGVEIPQMVNQAETHVFDLQIEAKKYMDELDCRIMSWGSLAEGRNNFFQNELLATIGKKYGKSIPQVAL